MRLIFNIGLRQWAGEVDRALQRCTAVIGWDGDPIDPDEYWTPIRCGATRHPHMVGPWECGHDEAEGVIVGIADSGAPVEVTYTLDERWSPMLLKMGL